MGKVSVTLNGRSYRLSCGDGEEARLKDLADHLRARVDEIVARFGQIGDDRMLVMAALMLADDLFETREELDRFIRAFDEDEDRSEPAKSA